MREKRGLALDCGPRNLKDTGMRVMRISVHPGRSRYVAFLEQPTHSYRAVTLFA